ncbi:MAG: hypothetical protein AVDCRST_MAG48-2350, partial [uncultured Friedmanniella sp.]
GRHGCAAALPRRGPGRAPRPPGRAVRAGRAPSL